LRTPVSLVLVIAVIQQAVSYEIHTVEPSAKLSSRRGNDCDVSEAPWSHVTHICDRAEIDDMVHELQQQNRTFICASPPCRAAIEDWAAAYRTCSNARDPACYRDDPNYAVSQAFVALCPPTATAPPPPPPGAAGNSTAKLQQCMHTIQTGCRSEFMHIMTGGDDFEAIMQCASRLPSIQSTPICLTVLDALNEDELGIHMMSCAKAASTSCAREMTALGISNSISNMQTLYRCLKQHKAEIGPACEGFADNIRDNLPGDDDGPSFNITALQQDIAMLQSRSLRQKFQAIALNATISHLKAQLAKDAAVIANDTRVQMRMQEDNVQLQTLVTQCQTDTEGNGPANDKKGGGGGVFPIILLVVALLVASGGAFYFRKKLKEAETELDSRQDLELQGLTPRADSIVAGNVPGSVEDKNLV